MQNTNEAIPEVKSRRDVFDCMAQVSESDNPVEKIKKRFACLLDHSAMTDKSLRHLYNALNSSRSKHIINLATSRYLHYWLSTTNSERFKKNLREFTTHEYSFLCDKHEDLEVNYEYQKFWRSWKNFQAIADGQHRVAYGEKRAFSPVSVKGDTKYDIPLNMDELWMTDIMRSSATAVHGARHGDLLILYFERKRLLGTTTEKKKNISLISAYENYVKLFENIASSNLSDFKYIVNCIMLHEVEYTTHFLFSMALVQYMKKKAISKDFSKYKDHLLYFYARTSEIGGIPIWKAKNGLIAPYVSYDIFPKGFDFRYIFEFSDKTKKFWHDFFVDIIILHDLLLCFIDIYPPEHISIETDEDIKAIRRFYEQNFPILEICKRMFSSASVTFDSSDLAKDDICYNYIRELYEFLIKSSEKLAYRPGNQPRDLVRQSLKESRSREKKAKPT